MAVSPYEDCREMLPASERTNLFQIGTYRLTKGGAAEKFWPIDPAKTHDVGFYFLDPACVMPGILMAKDYNTLVFPPSWGIFDIIIHVSDDYDDFTDEQKPPIAADEIASSYHDLIIGKPEKLEMPLAVDTSRNARIAFGVYIAGGTPWWEGMLHLEAGGHALELPLRVERVQIVEDLFIFFIPHDGQPQTRHAWCKVKVMDKGGQPIQDAKSGVKVLRNRTDYDDINRRVQVYSQDDGYLAAFGTRKTIGLPVAWPLIFNVTKDGYVLRGHMLKLKPADSKDNSEPLDKPEDRTGIQILAVSEVDMSSKTILLDPGHGVVYGDKKNRRCYEWYSANRMAEKVAEILTQRFHAKILWTRTAGFGLIAPDQMDDPHAPENGKKRYSFDLTDPAARTIHANVKMPAKQLSDLLLTEHYGTDNIPQPVAVSRRNDLIRVNQETVKKATQRLIEDLENVDWKIQAETLSWNNDGFEFNVQRVDADPSAVDVGTGRVAWDDAAKQYRFTVAMIDPTAIETSQMKKAQVLTINADDVFTVDNDMMGLLEDRSVRWSLANEMGDEKDPDFADAARKAMLAAGAFDYMKAKCQWSNNQLKASPLLLQGTMGWSSGARFNYFNGKDDNGVAVSVFDGKPAAADFIVTIHENAGTAIGSLIEVADGTQPLKQLQIAKTFLKYMDPFDQGLSGAGILNNHDEVTLVDDGDEDNHRSKYAYLELDFMNAHSPRNHSIYQYQEMLDDAAYFTPTAEQIVGGIVEWLFLRQDQETFDAIKFNAGTKIW